MESLKPTPASVEADAMRSRTRTRLAVVGVVVASVVTAGVISASPANSLDDRAEVYEHAERGEMSTTTTTMPSGGHGGSGGTDGGHGGGTDGGHGGSTGGTDGGHGGHGGVSGGHSMQLPGINNQQGSGRASNDVLRVNAGYFGSPNGLGDVRITCGVSHHAYADPIVFPGQANASHMHTFFGNAGTDENSTYESLRNEPRGSTCAGGAVNKSAYWFPSLIDSSSNSIVEPTLTYVYYKTGYWGQDGRDVQDIPNGLRMVSGNAAATSPQAQWTVNWACSYHQGGVPVSEIRRGSSIQSCARGELLEATILFPQCWNGRDLDSPNHQSHMAHPSFQGNCPSSHPVLLPQITVHATWIMGSAGSNSLYLASDMMTPDGAPPGMGLHADFFDGWDPASKEALVDNCLNGRRDCGVRSLGDGYLLLDT